MSENNTVSNEVALALSAALSKIETYVPTNYVDNSEPDIDAENLNHAEQAIMRVTNLANAAVDVIQNLQSQLDTANSAISGLNAEVANRLPYWGSATASTKVLDSSTQTIIDTTNSADGTRFQLIFNFTNKKLVVSYFDGSKWVPKELGKW